MLKRLLNLPFSVASRAARAYQDREDARVREEFRPAADPADIAVAPSAVPLAEGAEADQGDVTVDAATVRGWLAAGRPVELLDIRSAAERAAGPVVPGAVHIPAGELNVRVSELSWDRPVATLCGDGAESVVAVRFFRERGMEDTYAVRGGVPAWIGSGA